MMADPGDRGSAKAHETMRAFVSSSICLAAEPRKPSRPAAISLHEQAGYATASTGIAMIGKFPCQGEVVHTRRSARTAPRRSGPPSTSASMITCSTASAIVRRKSPLSCLASGSDRPMFVSVIAGSVGLVVEVAKLHLDHTPRWPPGITLNAPVNLHHVCGH